jgi:tetratricopeptide (TPR) repeat protein
MDIPQKETRMKNLIACSTIALNLMFAPVAYAAGSSDGGSSSEPSSGNSNATATSPKKLKCKKNEVIKNVTVDGKKKKKCVVASSGVLSDDELYEQGVALAKESEYDWALQVLSQIKNQNDPKVLNYMGYSHRKAGRLETGITYYNRALAINPDFVLAREYLGEGYVAAGMIDEAKVQLAEISARCGTTCVEYVDLKKVIDTAIN